MRLVVDGQLLGEMEYRWKKDQDRPANLSLVLGGEPSYGYEYPIKVGDVNVFKSSLSVERMEGLTRAGEEECGAAGDYVSWDEAEWALHSQAKVIEVERKWAGPCRRESQVQVFGGSNHQDCMHHCEKIKNGRSPPVTTEEEWESLWTELNLVNKDLSRTLTYIWISVTEGDKNNELERLDHWPETELVKNQTMKLEAVETIWRDFYTGQRLNWSLSWGSGKDTKYYETSNCLRAYMAFPDSWSEMFCNTDYTINCPCSYPVKPVLRLRGRCSTLIDYRFLPTQPPYDPENMILVGYMGSRFEYNGTSSQWVLSYVPHMWSDVTAVSPASKHSYLLGKHEWTISNDVYECNKGKPYTTMLKLTGCKEEGEFTCDDGQCIKMEERCNQVPDCRDESDENGCQLILLKNNYNKYIPPIRRAKGGSAIPSKVSISINLMQIVEIEEVDHSIHLQFKITLQWKDNRVKYQNLKEETSLNALTAADIGNLWLPLVIYENTDQKESTRLGMTFEWATRVSVIREGNFTRSGVDRVDETEMFEGAENTLTMAQTYTWEFQCHYRLQHYPFDTQVQL